MGVGNDETRHASRESEEVIDQFEMSDSDEEHDGVSEKESQRALERDIDEKVQFWVDCIQASVPGAVILPVATFDDFFDEEEGGVAEAKRRCKCMKDRLLDHEQRRTKGLQQRLNDLEAKKQASSEMAIRIRQLLAARPKLIFDAEGRNGVLRISSTKYTGFCRLREKIINIATGRDFGGSQFPLFRGHVGAIIPRVRLEVRNVIRERRKELRVVEMGQLLSILRQSIDLESLWSEKDLCDALLFLSNIGELSFFGRVGMHLSIPHGRAEMWASYHTRDSFVEDGGDFPLDNKNPEDREESGADGSESEDISDKDASDSNMEEERGYSSHLEEYVFLNPRWLVAVVACILRHDLRQAIVETKQNIDLREQQHDDASDWQQRGGVYSAYANSPIITSAEACMLWKAKSAILKAAKHSMASGSSSTSRSVFEFLQDLLTRFNVLVPIDLSVEKAQFAGEELGAEFCANSQEGYGATGSKFFFLPSLLGPSAPPEQIWTHKCSVAYKTAVCVSWRFSDGCPPGFMERVSAFVLRAVYAATTHKEQPDHGDNVSAHCKLRLHKVFCWRSAFMLQLGMCKVPLSQGGGTESLLEIFATLVDRDDPGCIAAKTMTVGTRRLVISAKGRNHKIWKGG
jgi:hypothetical protein